MAAYERVGWIGVVTERSFQDVLGMEFVEATGDKVVITCKVTPEMHQPYGILHGGIYCSIVESAASIGAAVWLGDEGNVVGVSNTTNFIRATREGTLTGTATPLQRGRTQQLWQVEIVDDTGRLCAQGQVRLANLRSADGLGKS